MEAKYLKQDECSTCSDVESDTNEATPLMVGIDEDSIESSIEERPRIRTPSPYAGSFESRPYGRFVVSSFDELPARLRNPPVTGNMSPAREAGDGAEDRPPSNFGLCLTNLVCFSDFRIIVPFQVFLLVLPISAGFMGARNIENCPMNRNVPNMLMVFGVLFTASLLGHIGLNIYRKCLNDPSNAVGVSYVLAASDFVVTTFFFLETYFFFKQPPNADPAAENYCDETFYYFTLRMNYGTIVLFFIFATFQLMRFLLNRTTAAEE